MTLIKLTLISLIVISCQKEQRFTSKIITIKKGVVSKKIEFIGRIRAENTVLVRSPIHSQLVKLYKTLGAQIKKDEIIAEISEPENNDRLDRIIQAEGLLRQTIIEKSKINLKIKEAHEELEQMSRLLASGSVSRSEQKSAQITYDLSLKELQILSSEEKTTRKSIDLWKKNQKNSSKILRAPAAGTITELWAPEDKITPGISIPKDTIIVVIEEPGKYILKGDVMEADYAQLQIDQTLEIKLSFLKGQSWQGKIKSLSPLSNQEMYGIGRFGVTALFSSMGKDIRTGLQGQATVILAQENSKLRVPRSAVIKRGQEYYISLPSENGPQDHRIQPGFIGDQFMVVEAGLIEGNQIYASYPGSR